MSACSSVHIWCPCCECAVRELNDQPCPQCQRCPFCGRKLNVRKAPCHCAGADDPILVETLLRDHGVPDSRLSRERRRAAVRVQLQLTKGIVGGVGGGLLLTTAIICRAAIGTQSTYEILASAVVIIITTLLVFHTVPVVIRFLEERRLNSEFPEANQI